MNYPKLELQRLSGKETFIDKDGELGFHVLDFWQWSCSDLVTNVERGKLAEFIVASALGLTRNIAQTWGAYDILSEEGIKIEVKSSSYIQSWNQSKLSPLSFNIAPTKAFDDTIGMYEEEKRRQSDVYVFCAHVHKDQNTVCMTDLRQWEFYVISTSTLNEKCNSQKRISLKPLIDIGAKKCNYNELKDEIISVAEKSS